MAPQKARWFDLKVSVGNVINFVVLIFLSSGFYFTTNGSLGEHTKRIRDLEKVVTLVETKMEGLGASERTNRDKVRDELLLRMDKQTDSIVALNVKTASLEVALSSIQKDLVRVGNQIEAAIRDKRSNP